MNLLKQRFVADLSKAEVDLAGLALLAIEIVAVSSDPLSAAAAQSANLRAQEQLEQLAAGARLTLNSAAGGNSVAQAQQGAAALVNYLGKSLGFTGNVDNYYSANNSDLGWVLDERRGIPITLAIVYIAVGRALGLDVRGIGFPGHFLVGVYAGPASGSDSASEAQLIDPFSGSLVSRQDCMHTLALMRGESDFSGPIPVENALFTAGAPPQIILRLLENLKQIHLQRGAAGPALAALDLQILVVPDNFELRTQHEALVGQMFGRRPGQNEHPDVH